MALLNFEWLSRVCVDGGEVEFSGDEEEDCFHGLQASVSARLSFGGLEQFIDSFDEAIGLAWSAATKAGRFLPSGHTPRCPNGRFAPASSKPAWSSSRASV